MSTEGPQQRALHNHVFQIKPRHLRRSDSYCPACSSIDDTGERMEAWYAQAWYARIKADRDMERALRQ